MKGSLVESSEGVSVDSIIFAYREFWQQEIEGFDSWSLYGLALQISAAVHQHYVLQLTKWV